MLLIHLVISINMHLRLFTLKTIKYFIFCIIMKYFLHFKLKLISHFYKETYKNLFTLRATHLLRIF